MLDYQSVQLSRNIMILVALTVKYIIQLAVKSASAKQYQAENDGSLQYKAKQKCAICQHSLYTEISNRVTIITKKS